MLPSCAETGIAVQATAVQIEINKSRSLVIHISRGFSSCRLTGGMPSESQPVVCIVDDAAKRESVDGNLNAKLEMTAVKVNR